MNADILNNIKFNLPKLGIVDYFRALNNIKNNVDLSRHKPIRVAILRSYTCEAIETTLKLQLILEGYNPEFFFGGYNQYSQDTLDKNSEFYKFKPDLIILLVRIEDLLPDFIMHYGEKMHSEWEKEFNHSLQLLYGIFEYIASRTKAQMLVQNFCLSTSYFGIYDSKQTSSQSSLVAFFNQSLKITAEKYSNLFIWDFEKFISIVGHQPIYDPKMWYVAHNPYSQSGYIKITTDLMRYILSIFGKVTKCIVLDLDNTLWGGIVGEDGIQGIALGNDYPGNCYVDFQLELLKLYNRGIILAINSKNNEKDALDVLDNHPCMILRRKHFAAMKINWQDKLGNIRALAEELNIGVDSMVFIDDNPVECEFVRKNCDCCVVQISLEPYLIPQLINTIPLIENIRLTSEDLKKGEIYRTEMSRKALEKSSVSLEGFLKDLEMVLEIKPVDEFTVARVAQLTQKTNQFNMTTKRYLESDIVNFINSDKHDVFVVSAVDRFGDHGNIGAFILKFEDNICFIDTFLLSCRVIGRTVEKSMLAFIAEFCRKKDIDKIIAEFVPGAKNSLAENFYLESGLKQVGNNKFIAELNNIDLVYSIFIKTKEHGK